MQMKNRLPAMGAGIDDAPVAIFMDTLLFRYSG